MIGFARAMVSAMSRFLGDAARTFGRTPTTLTVVVPAPVSDEVAERLAQAVGTLLRARARALDVERWWDTAVERDPAQKGVVVRLASRPVAVVSEPYTPSAEPSWIAAVVDATDTALRRRLSVLADIPDLLASAGITEPGPAQLDAVALLLDCGVSWRRVTPVLAELEPGVRHADLGEFLVDELAPREIVLEVAEATVRSVDPTAPDQVVRMRAQLYADTGTQVPDIRLSVLDEAPGTLRITLNDVVLRRNLGPDARWDDVVAALDRAVREVAFWFVRTSDVGSSLAELAAALPDLVGLAQRSYPDVRIAGCLRETVRQGDSTRNLQRILWLLMQMVDDVDPDDVAIVDPVLLAGPAAVGRITAAPASLVAGIRRMDADEAADDGGPSSDVGVVVPPEIESVLRHPGDPAEITAAERTLLGIVTAAPEPNLVEVRYADAVPRVRAALQPLPRPPRVIAAQERPLRAQR